MTYLRTDDLDSQLNQAGGVDRTTFAKFLRPVFVLKRENRAAPVAV